MRLVLTRCLALRVCAPAAAQINLNKPMMPSRVQPCVNPRLEVRLVLLRRLVLRAPPRPVSVALQQTVSCTTFTGRCFVYSTQKHQVLEVQSSLNASKRAGAGAGGAPAGSPCTRTRGRRRCTCAASPRPAPCPPRCSPQSACRCAGCPARRPARPAAHAGLGLRNKLQRNVPLVNVRDDQPTVQRSLRPT